MRLITLIAAIRAGAHAKLHKVSILFYFIFISHAVFQLMGLSNKEINPFRLIL